MNLLILIGMIAVYVPLGWAIQSIVLWWSGLPQVLPLRYNTEISAVRWTGRLLIQGLWLLILIGFPYAIGSSPTSYFSRAFGSVEWGAVFGAFLLALLIFTGGILLEIKLGLIRFVPQLEARARRRKVIRRFFSPVPVAFLEETVFRGVLLEQLDRVLSGSSFGTAMAIVASSIVFSASHFIRPLQPGIAAWRAATGLFCVGCVLGICYVSAGHSLWLPIAVHAAGILVTEIQRLYTDYRASPAVIGYPTFPHCGAIGVSSLALFTFLIL